MPTSAWRGYNLYMLFRLAWLPVAALTVVSALARFGAARLVDAPWIYPDELTYALLGRSFWHSGSLSVIGGVTAGYSLVYPAVVGAPLSLFGPSSGLLVAQLVQAFAMSSVALVVFAWGRQVVAETWALGAAALTVALPGLAYSGLLMTETLFYPLVTLALWAQWRALLRPSIARQAVFLAATAAAVLTRVQAVALLPAAVLALALYCLFVRDATVLRRSTPLLGAILAAGTIAVGASVAAGGWGDVLGVYGAAAGGYELGAAVRDIFWHAGGLFVMVVGVPLIALALLFLECARGRESKAGAALVATASSWALVTVVEVGTFASKWVDHIAERDLLTVAPPLFLTFALWLARGMPRPRAFTSVIVLVVVAPAILLPVARFASRESALDSFSFIPLWRLEEMASSEWLQVAYAVGVGLVVVAAVLVPPRAGVAVFGLVASTLVLASIVSSREIQQLAAADRTWVFSTTQPSWIDEVADGPTTFIHADTELPKALFQTVYWNERIDRVLQLEGAPGAAPIATESAAVLESGLVRDEGGKRLDGGLVVAPSSIVLQGRDLASYGPATDMPGLTLWRADSPLRVLWTTSGVQANGDIDGTARIVVPRCAQGHLGLTLLGKSGASVEISVDGIVIDTVAAPPGAVWTGEVSAPAYSDGTDICTFRIQSAGLLGSTRIEFVRA